MRAALDSRLVGAAELPAEARRLREEGWRFVTATALPRDGGWTVIYHFERGGRLAHLRLEVGRGGHVPAIDESCPGAYLVENEMHELQAVPVTGMALDYGGRLYRDLVVSDGEAAETPAETAGPPSERPTTVVPFGPQHPVLAEPIQLELSLHGDVVADVSLGLGYVHRAIEAEAERRPFDEDVLLLERVCGICSVAHGVAYAQAVEALAGVEVPRRARLIRTFFFELTRLHSHLLWLGLAADSIGFEALFQSCWRVREGILDLFAATAGARVIISIAVLGGVRADLPVADLGFVRRRLDELETDLDGIAPFVLGDEALARRLAGVGRITHEDAAALGAVGPTARASGVALDVRLTGYAGYDELAVEPVVETGGDALARVLVRWREIGRSLALCRETLALLETAPGPLRVRVPPILRGEAIARVEAPRGELFYYVAADGGPCPSRVRIRTPTFANLPALVRMLPGTQMAAVPVALLSIDPCLSCTER